LRYSLLKDRALKELKNKYHIYEEQYLEYTYNKLLSFPLIQSILESQKEKEIELDINEFKELLLKDYLNYYLKNIIKILKKIKMK